VSDENPVVRANGGAVFGDPDVTQGGAVYQFEEEVTPMRNGGGHVAVISMGGQGGDDVYAAVNKPPRKSAVSSPAGRKTVDFSMQERENKAGEEDPITTPQLVKGETFTNPAYTGRDLPATSDIYIPESRHTEQSATMAFAHE
jgi:hypothetical protein